MNEPENLPWVNERLERWRSKRDADALGELLKWQRVRAYATAVRILRQSQDAEDAVQQGFLKLLTRTQGFENLQAFKAAVYRAVVQCALDVARSRQARTGRESRMQTAEAPASTAGLRSAEHQEALDLLQEELGQLNLDQRALVTLCCQEGLNLTEAAEALGAPRETLRDRLARTLSELRSRLNKRGIRLSIFLLLGLLYQGQAQAAPASLGAALDTSLPGAGCAGVPAAGNAAVHAHGLLAEAGLAGTGLALKLALPALVLLTLLAVWRIKSDSTPESPSSVPAPESRIPAASPSLSPAPSAKLAPKLESVPTPAQPEKPKQVDAQLPPAARDAVETLIKGFKITKVEKATRAGETVYELEGTLGDKRLETVVTAEGKVLQIAIAEDDDEDERPVKPQPVRPPGPTPDPF